MRESTKATRATILQSAKEIFLECGYQEASMRKIAARAGITPGAIYKHFSGKEEMFGEIFAESGNKLMALSESMLDIDFSAMSDEQLMQVFYSRISIRTLELLEDDMQLFHMLLKNDSGTYIRNFRKVYIGDATNSQRAFIMSYTCVDLRRISYPRKHVTCCRCLSSR